MYKKFHSSCWLEIDLGRIKNDFREIRKMTGNNVKRLAAKQSA